MAVVTDTRKRVKLYSFTDNLQWEDLGTGQIMLTFMERMQGVVVIVRSEEDGSVLLESKVMPNRTYQKQEETLIVWSEDDSCDLALSFQEKLGCDEVWGKICEIQGRDPSVDITQDISEDGDMSDRIGNTSTSIELPPCELNKLDEIFESITGAMCDAIHREAFALAMERDNYVVKLLELFHMCEDLDNLDGLHHLYNIFRTMFLLNKASLLTIMFHDDNIMSVVGCLEYEPNKLHPVQHRKYLRQTSRHREVLPFDNPQLMAKIHQTYRVQYIQDVILPTPSLFEENMMSALNSFVLFNKTEIVNCIQNDRQFLSNLFAELSSESTTEDRFRELALFLRELCSFALALELQDGTKFYQRLCSYGLMPALEQMLLYEVEDMVVIAVDVLNQLADYNSALLRDHILKHQSDSVDEDNQFLNIIIGLLVDAEITSNDVQVVGLIRTLIDPENIMTETSAQTVEKTIFLNYFYKHCMHRLMAPMMAQTTGDRISRDTAQNAVLLGHILELLSLCVERHTYHIRKYVIDKNLLGRVLVLMTSSHGHLALAALRFCRRIVGLKDEFYNRYLVNNNLFGPIVKAFMANGQRYNLLNSAIIELFEFIKSEKLNILVVYTVETFMHILETVEYVTTFKSLKLCYEQSKEHANKPADPSLRGGIIHNIDISRYRRDVRDLDEDEEAWFDDEEEEEISSMTENIPPPHPPPISPVAGRLHSPLTAASIGFSPRPANMAAAISRSLLLSSQPKLASIALQSLVDYDEDSDEEQQADDDSDSTKSPAKRQKLETS